ncbi:MAG: helix-turn-helix transcriptional regulator [Blastocatellia bacterium]
MTKEKLLSLTPREKEVLIMLADGYSNREVGVILSISHRTVEAHRLNIMLKLEKLHIVDLVKFAIKHQLTSVNKHKSKCEAKSLN